MAVIRRGAQRKQLYGYFGGIIPVLVFFWLLLLGLTVLLCTATSCNAALTYIWVLFSSEDMASVL